MATLIDWKRIREGDKSVFDKMFDFYYQPMCSFILPYLKNTQLVEDIVIDCFAKIWEEHQSLDIKSSLRNYLVTVVKNSAISYLRKKQLQLSDLKTVPDFASEESTDETDDIDLMTRLYEAINKLPEQRRKILKMAAFEDKSYHRIAEELDISINTVKTQMARSYKFLKDELNVPQKTIYFLLFMQ